MNELLAALLADRTNTERFSVYADSLEATGSPQGQLISLMLAREKTPTRKLYTAQKEQLAKVWLGPDAPESTAWWRGFVREAHFESMEQLALLDHPLLSLLDTAGLDLPGDAWDEWLGAIGTRPGWLSVRLNIEAGEEPLPIAPLLDALPNLRSLRISFGPSWGSAGTLDFVDARSASLERLVLERVETIASLTAEDFPRLEELKLIRTEELDDRPLRAGSCWPRLKRVVLDEALRDPSSDGPHVHGFAEAEENDPSAFVIVAERVDPALVRTLIASTPGLERLIGDFATVHLHGRELTVMRLFGSGATHLFPYAVARSLERHFGKRRVPIASFALSEYASLAQGYAQSPEIFADKRPYEERDLLVREVLDGVLGFDPGLSTLHEVLDALASAASITLVGADGDAALPPLLCEIDPGVKPPADPQDDYDYDGPTDMYGDIEVPEPEPLAIGVLPEVVPDEPPLAAVEVDELHEEEHEETPEEPDGLPDDPDHVWAEGPVDPDPDWAEPKEDPDADLDVPLSADLLSAESACAHCDQVAPLRRCVECADLCCAQCARQRLSTVTCLRCAP